MIHDATPATVAAILVKAQGGDTIQLGAGDYPPVALSKRTFDPPLTIKGRADAVVASLNAVQCKGLILDSLNVLFTPTATTKSSSPAVRFYQCEKIVLRGSKIVGGPAVSGVPITATALDSTGNVIGLPTGYGVAVQDCKDVTIAGNDVSQFYRGVVPGNSDGITISGNVIHHMRTSPITGGGNRNVTIERNHLHTSTPWNYSGAGDHGDYIHLWTVAGKPAIGGIVIRDNFLDQGAGQAMLGIYLDDNNLLVGFENVLIEGNVILNAMRQAIQVECTTGLIRRNTMITPVEITDKRFLPTVLVWDKSRVEISDNIMGKAPVVETADGASFTGSGNLIVDRPDYAKTFAPAPTLAAWAPLGPAGSQLPRTGL